MYIETFVSTYVGIEEIEPRNDIRVSMKVIEYRKQVYVRT